MISMCNGNKGEILYEKKAMDLLLEQVLFKNKALVFQIVLKVYFWSIKHVFIKETDGILSLRLVGTIDTFSQ